MEAVARVPGTQDIRPLMADFCLMGLARLDLTTSDTGAAEDGRDRF